MNRETRNFCLERRGNEIVAGRKTFPGIMTINYPKREAYFAIAIIHDDHIKMLVSDKEIWNVVMDEFGCRKDRLKPESVLRFKKGPRRT